MPYYTKNMVKYLRQTCAVDDKQSKAASGVSSAAASGASKASGASSAAPSSYASNAGGSKVSGAEVSATNKHLRITPSCIDEDPDEALSKLDNDSNFKKANNNMTFNEKRLLFMRNLLKIQVNRIASIEPFDMESEKQVMQYYEIKQNVVLFQSKHTGPVLRCQSLEFPDLVMTARLFNTAQIQKMAQINPNYFKILRHIGKKHPCLVQTWEIVTASPGKTWLLQEMCNKGDLPTYLAKNGPQPESVVCEWAKELFKALDYLGDMGVCHRNICPRYIMLHHKDLNIKLTGFYDALVYWDVVKEDILYFPCKPMSQINRSAPDFQAPEVYGDPDKEEYDPICADGWSYGAVLFVCLASEGAYPYNYKVENAGMESEIAQNVSNLKISSEGSAVIGGLLCANALKRLGFERLTNNAWFSKFKREYSNTQDSRAGASKSKATQKKSRKTS